MTRRRKPADLEFEGAAQQAARLGRCMAERDRLRDGLRAMYAAVQSGEVVTAADIRRVLRGKSEGTEASAPPEEEG